MIKVQNNADGRYVSLTLRGSEVEDVEYFVDSLLNNGYWVKVSQKEDCLLEICISEKDLGVV